MTAHLEGGHTETVLCCAVSSGGHIISGGEGGQLCIWSLDGAPPQKFQISDSGEDLACICCSKNKSYEFHAACGSNIYAFDLRNVSSPLYTFKSNEDEINQIALNEKEDFLAACDDSGQIKVYNLIQKQLYKTLRKHTNICASVAFRPRRPWDLLSGGFDYHLLQWEFSRNRSVCNINMQEIGLDQELPNSYMVSPPFIYSLAVSPSGHQVACGTENALVQLFSASKRTLTFVASLRAHSSGVSQVHFPAFADNLLISGGNDGKLFFWDTESCAAKSGSAHNGVSNGVSNGVHNGVSNGVSNGVHNGISNGVHNGVSNGVSNGIHNGVSNGVHNVGASVDHDVENGVPAGANNGLHNYAAEVNVEEVNDGQETAGHCRKLLQRPQLQPKYQIDHGNKIQWLASLMRNDQPVLVVADNTSSLSLYNIPQ